MKIKLLLILTVVGICLNACAEGEPAGPSGQAAPTNLSFSDQTKASGVSFTHVPSYSEQKWMPEVMAAGVVIADFNRDGAPDLVFTNSGRFGAESRPDNAGNALFINDGKGKFTDKTTEWNLTGVGYGQGAAVGDFDNDGLTDLFLTSFEGDNRLLRNTGEKFIDITEQSGIKPDGKWTTSAGFADFDGDGRLDIFVVKYIGYSKENHQETYRNRLMTYSAPYLYSGVADQIWRNEGDGKFKDVSSEAGITDAAQKGLALGIADIDKDGDEDVYVANDTTPNQLWINDGKGKFTDQARLSGSAYSEGGLEEGSMGVDFADIDDNGRLEIVVTNFQAETTALYDQMEPMLFRETSDAAGIGQTARQRLSFGIDFFDADNDGDEDLLVANGHIEDNIEKNSDSVTFAQQNSLYENIGGGKFRDVSDAAGDALQDRQVSRGLATGDLNGDGLIDFVVANNGGTAQIAFNNAAKPGNFAGFWLEGVAANRNAIGARLIAKIGDKTYEQQIMGAQSYLSISDFRINFGLGQAEKIDQLTIFWPAGEKQIITDIAAGKYYYVKQQAEPVPFTPGERRFE